MNKILALDVSSVSTGWAVLDTNKKLYHFGLIEIPKLKLNQKLLWFKNYLESLLQTMKPNIILVEDVYLKNVTTLKILAQFIGIVNLLSCMYNIPILFLSPNTVRSSFKIKTKIDVFDFIKNKYKVKFKTISFEEGNDITDAILLALYYVDKLKGEYSNE